MRSDITITNGDSQRGPARTRHLGAVQATFKGGFVRNHVACGFSHTYAWRRWAAPVRGAERPLL